MSTEHLIKHFGEILHQMEAVGDLSRPRGACTGSVDVGFHTVSGDDGDTRMIMEPVRQVLRLAIIDQRDWPAVLHGYCPELCDFAR
jgi:hypothetical protein